LKIKTPKKARSQETLKPHPSQPTTSTAVANDRNKTPEAEKSQQTAKPQSSPATSSTGVSRSNRRIVTPKRLLNDGATVKSPEKNRPIVKPLPGKATISSTTFTGVTNDRSKSLIQKKTFNDGVKTEIELSESESDYEDVKDWSETDSLIESKDTKEEKTYPKRQQFVCSICCSWEEVSDGGMGHYKDVHGIDLQDPDCILSNRWPCIYCTSSFKTNQILLEHLAAFHQVLEHWTCVFCSGVFLERQDFATYLAEHLVMKTHNHRRSYDAWNCFLCDFFSQDPNEILNHMNENHLKEPVTLELKTCPRCRITDYWMMIFNHLQRICNACEERF
jgi:hypothetical protein